MGQVQEASEHETRFTVVVQIHGRRRVVGNDFGERGGYGEDIITEPSFTLVNQPPRRTWSLQR